MSGKTFFLLSISVFCFLIILFVPDTAKADCSSGCACFGWCSSGWIEENNSCIWGGMPGTCCCPEVNITNFSADDATVYYGESTTLRWNSSNARFCWACCEGDWRGSKGTSGSESTGSLTSRKVYDLACYPYGSYDNPDSVRDLETVVVDVRGECSLGSTQTRNCGAAGTPCFGTQTRLCQFDRTWSGWSSCPTDGNSCGNCGTCSGGSCTGQGECSPGDSFSRPCSYCVGRLYYTGGSQSRSCRLNCTWRDFSSCSGATGSCNAAQCGAECSDGYTSTCGNCGTQICQSDCTLGPCTGEGECSPGVDSPDCPCPSDECIGFDYYDYPENNGDCLSVCDCDTGTGSGQPCELTVSYYDAKCPFGFENPLETGRFETIINTLINFIFKIALVLAPLMIIIAGFLFVTAGADLERAAKAKRIIIWTIIALIVILIAKGIWSLVQQILRGF